MVSFVVFKAGFFKIIRIHQKKKKRGFYNKPVLPPMSQLYVISSFIFLSDALKGAMSDKNGFPRHNSPI